MPRRGSQNPFTTVRSEGGLLPAELLQRVVDADRALAGMASSDYHLGPSERLNERISRSWNRLVGIWTSFAPSLAKMEGDGEPGTGPTRERWLLPLFTELDFGRLQPAKAEEIDGKSFPVSHRWGSQVPIHLVGGGVDLDHRSAGVAGAAKASPHGLVQELLNRTEALWGIVSNGRLLRLLRDNASLTRQAYVEFDLEAMMSGDVYADFALLFLLLHESRFEAEQPAECILERWVEAAQVQGTRIREQLRTGVEKAIETLGAGFLAHPANASLREKLRSGDLSTQDYYRQLLRLVYRLIFLFVAEDRDLLHQAGTPEGARTTYQSYYSSTRLRNLAERRRGTRHPDLFEVIKVVTTALGRDDGVVALGLPFLGGYLFSPGACRDLDGSYLANVDLLGAVRALAFTVEDNVLRAVDYRNLGSEELGSVYESLLELHPEIDAEAAAFSLTTAAGNERKTTGSYYTPTPLISALLDSALEPVLEEAASKPDPEAALLELKVLDPACGSGHFLVAAAHRIARKLAAVRTGEDEPSPQPYRGALHDVISSCVYGIDLNPMAVELCKVSLWMEAVEPGKPLSFLDHHIVCGNSLLGTTPKLLADGLPDDAFTTLEGDDKRVVFELRKRNREEREGQQLFDLGGSSADLVRPVAQAVDALEHLSADSSQGLHEKERLWSEIEQSKELVHAKLLADAWCAAFAMHKEKGAPAITEGMLRLLRADPTAGGQALHDGITALASDYRFLHPHLAFPGVFRVPPVEEAPENPDAGWSGGFDVVIGNPPWLSYSGRQKVEITAHQLRLLVHLAPEVSSWPSTHSAFVLKSLALLRNDGRAGLVAPLQILHLERYGALRTSVAQHAVVTVEDVGEDAFENVSQRVGLFAFNLRTPSPGQSAWSQQQSDARSIASPSTSHGEDSLFRDLLERLQLLPKFPPSSFSDPGVHTGNVSKLIVSESFPRDDPEYVPVREGRNINSFYCGEPRKLLWVHPELADGQYCTIRKSSVYLETPILLRQTASRPIACRHLDRTYFRNSVLACSGVAGLPDEVVVAVLNSEVIRRWYQGAVQESGQRAFPQVKIRNLRQLPLPPEDGSRGRWSATLSEKVVELTRAAEAQRVAGSMDPTLLVEIESLVCVLYALPDALTGQLLDALAASLSPEEVST